MEILIYILLSLSLIFNILLGIYFYQTFFNLIPKYEDFITKMLSEFQETYDYMKSVDLRYRFSDSYGAMENDDEVGQVYSKIKKSIENLKTFLTSSL
jgi:hypothetical protein